MAIAAIVASPALASATSAVQAAPPRMVFAHYMVCCSLNGPAATIPQLATEIRLARGSGIDGFSLDIGDWSEGSIYRLVTDRFFAAALSSPGFHLFLSADTATGLTPAQAAAMLLRYRKSPAYLHVDGRPVLSTFGSTSQWGREVLALLRAQDVTPFFVPGTQRLRAEPSGGHELPDAAFFRQILADDPGLDGYFYFGAAGTGDRIAASSRAAAAVARGAGKLAMVPVTPYYLGRGGNNRVFENDGFAAMAAQWRAAIESKAPWVQIVTWNDWTENSYVRPFASPAISPEHWPSLLAHDGFLEASRPYIAWFKTGREPAIKGTRVTLFFRPQTSPGCGPGGVGGRDPLACPSGWQTLRDRLWVDVESAAPVRLRIANGGRDTTVTLPAGRQTHEVPLSPGLLSIDAQAGEWRRIWNAPVHIGADARRFGRGMIAVSL